MDDVLSHYDRSARVNQPLGSIGSSARDWCEKSSGALAWKIEHPSFIFLAKDARNERFLYGDPLPGSSRAGWVSYLGFVVGTVNQYPIGACRIAYEAAERALHAIIAVLKK